ncbi:acid stress response protein YqgB [Escherichia coli]|nr:acid stress response protein YqgB [Escherichia coli]
MKKKPVAQLERQHSLLEKPCANGLFSQFQAAKAVNVFTLKKNFWGPLFCNLFFGFPFFSFSDILFPRSMERLARRRD